MNKFLKILAFTHIFYTAGSAALPTETPTESQNQQLQAIEQHEKQVALVLAQQGFDAYAKLFHPEYRNWGLGRPPRDRATFLADSKNWYDKGNKAISVQMQPLHTEVFDELALSQYRLREDFNDGNTFVGYFVSLAKKSSEGWLFYNTTYHTEYYGPTAKAPAVEPVQAQQQ